MTNDCIFCKIVAGEIPSTKVYEDEKILAFLDIMPVNPGHTLIIPKKHFVTISDTPEEILSEMAKMTKKISQAVMAGTGSSAFNLNANSGKDAGQVVDHLHFHIIPRQPNDGFKLWQGGEYKPGEADMVAARIKDALQ